VKGNRRKLLGVTDDSTPESVRFGKQLRAIREANSISPAQLLASLKMDYDERSLRKWEEGKALWGAITLFNRLADTLGVTLDELFGRVPRTPQHRLMAEEVSAMLLPKIREEVAAALRDHAGTASAEAFRIGHEREQVTEHLVDAADARDVSTTPSKADAAAPESASPVRRPARGGR